MLSPNQRALRWFTPFRVLSFGFESFGLVIGEVCPRDDWRINCKFNFKNQLLSSWYRISDLVRSRPSIRSSARQWCWNVRQWCSSIRRLRLRLRICERVLRRLICSQDWHVSSCSPLIKALSSLTNLLFWLETSSSELEVGGGITLKSRKLLRTSRSVNFSYQMAKY